LTFVNAGRVGRPHGLDGSFHVERPDHPLAEGTAVTVAGSSRVVERRAGTDERPLVRLSGVDDRDAALALRGEPLLVDQELGDGEWLASDLVGLRVEELGTVARVLEGASCDILELADGTLVPLVSDAIQAIDLEAGTISVDREFLG
jgi:16S rRNA processing protein RimM